VNVNYKINVDDAYFRSVINRYYRQRPFLLRLTSQFSILGACLVVPWVYALVTSADWKHGAIVGIPINILVAVGAHYLTKVLILDKLRWSGHSTEGTVVLSEEGVTVLGQHGQSIQYWTTYSRAVRFSDGILLLRRGVIRWLPDSAIERGTGEEAAELVASKMAIRRLDQ
jgi:hypothetical protein